MKKYFISVIAISLLIWFACNRTANMSKKRTAAHHTGNGFRNPWTGFENRGFKDFLTWQWHRLRGRAPEKPESYPWQPVQNDGKRLRANRDSLTVTWVGHATTLIQIEGKNILTDPIWSDRCSPVSWAGPKRQVPPFPAFEDLPEIDAVVISHNHYDHLDKPTIQKLGNKVHYFVPLRLANLLARWGIKRENITELDWWQQAQFKGLDFVCTPTQHFSGRSLNDRNQTLWSSWAVLGKKHRVYFAGDTGYFPEFSEIGRRYGPFDLALVPIGAYRPRWFMSPVHVDPAEALRAFSEVQSKYMVAIHWGTFDLADEPLDEPPRLLMQMADSLAVDPESIWLLQHGESRSYPSAGNKK